MDRSEGKNMKIPLVYLGLDCEKKPLIHLNDITRGKINREVLIDLVYEGYNTRTAENENSVLVIDEAKQYKAIQDGIIHFNKIGMHGEMELITCIMDSLSKNAKSFIKICPADEKGK